MKPSPRYLNNKITLNVLANSVENAKHCYEAAEGNILLGILSKKYPSDDSAIEDMLRYKKEVNNAISVGLGAGDPNQSEMVSRISKEIQPQHVNQVFTGVGATRALLGQDYTVVNGLISPSGKIGYVNVATGPQSSQASDKADVPIKTAIKMLKDMGASSVKFYPMNGLSSKEEYKAVADACAEEAFILEPTGGITLDNFEEILRIALDAGVKKVIPHVYSSIIDKETGDTKPEDVKQLLSIMKKLS